MNKDSSSPPIVDQKALPIGMGTPKNRLAAFILDLIIIVPVVRLLQSPFRRGMVDAALLEKTTDLAQFQFLNSITFFVVFMLYHSVLTYWRGQTFGKMFFHIKVVSLTGQLSLLTALARSFFMLLGIFLLGVPLLTLFSHPLRRALHDRISDTVVVGLKEVAGLPNQREKLWAMGLTAFAFLFPLLIFISLAKIMSTPLSKKDGSLFSKNSSNHLPCDFALQEGHTEMKEAIELFLADQVTQECLNTFAQESLWKAQNIELAKFAMALSEYDRSEKSNSYLKSICKESPQHRLCFFSRWLMGQESKEGLSSDMEFQQLKTLAESEDFVKIFAASYALKARDFVSMEKWLGLVSRKNHLQRKVSQLFFHSLLGQERWEEALLVYHTHLTLEEDDLVAHLVNFTDSPQWSVEKKLRILERFSSPQEALMSRVPASDNSRDSVIELYRQSLLEAL